MLFYGYSRSDSYMNDLRDEVMTMLEHGHRPDEDAPAPVLGYHIEDVKDQSDEDVLAMLQYSRRHEGLCILPIRSSPLSPGCQWTAFLRRLVHATSQQQIFAMSLLKKRILCLERPYAQAGSRTGFEECAYALFVLTHAAVSPASSSAIFDSDAREFKRRRDDYNAMLSAAGRPAARSSQKLRLPGKGKIVVTFSVDELLKKAGDGSKWDLLLVGWEVEEECDVMMQLRSAKCFIPALAHQQFPAHRPTSTGTTTSAGSSLSSLRHKARARGFWDFCENNEAIYSRIQSCFEAE